MSWSSTTSNYKCKGKQEWTDHEHLFNLNSVYLSYVLKKLTSNKLIFTKNNSIK